MRQGEGGGVARGWKGSGTGSEVIWLIPHSSLPFLSSLSFLLPLLFLVLTDIGFLALVLSRILLKFFRFYLLLPFSSSFFLLPFFFLFMLLFHLFPVRLPCLLRPLPIFALLLSSLIFFLFLPLTPLLSPFPLRLIYSLHCLRALIRKSCNDDRFALSFNAMSFPVASLSS